MTQMRSHVIFSLRDFLRVFLLLTSLLSLGLSTDLCAKESIFLYRSPLTATFFAQNGTDYDTLLVRWHDYLKRYGKDSRDVTRSQLLAGLPKGVLVLGSAVLLDDSERNAIAKYVEEGGSILATWGTGARDGRGHWAGYSLIERLADMKVGGLLKREDNDWFLNTFGDSPLTWPQAAGRRFYMGKTAESPLRISGTNLAGRYLDWARTPNPTKTNGSIAFSEKGQSRRAYLSFSESSWEYISSDEFYPMLDAIIDWLRHHPRVFKAAWPNGHLSGHLIEMDTEDKYENAIHFAHDLEEIGAAGTFYSLTSISRKHPELVTRLAQHHEIGYHADVHVGFKGKTEDEQTRRIKSMIAQMTGSVGDALTSQVTGFRAPTESYDATTERILRKNGISHHVTHPSASEARLPYFSDAESNIGTDERIVGLPRTQGDDLNYQALKLPNPVVESMMLAEADMLFEMGALGVMSVHSQNYGDDGLMAYAMPPYLRRLAERRATAWVATGKEIATWWHARERVLLKDTTAGKSPTLHFSVRTPGDIRGLTFMVTHPSREQVLKAISPLGSAIPAHKIKRIDDYRSAVIFERLDVGDYNFELQF